MAIRPRCPFFLPSRSTLAERANVHSMPSIHICRKHKKPFKDAKAAVEKVASEVAEKFDLTHDWKGNTLHFERSGVSGQIVLEKDVLHVTVELGFLLSLLKPQIEQEIEKRLDQHFGTS